MPVIVDNGDTMSLYPQEVTHTDPKYKLGQTVPNYYNTPHIIVGIRMDVDCREEWVPNVPPTPGENPDNDGNNTLVITPTEWEYKLVRVGNDGRVKEWGWIKQSEIDKDIAENAGK